MIAPALTWEIFLAPTEPCRTIWLHNQWSTYFYSKQYQTFTSKKSRIVHVWCSYWPHPNKMWYLMGLMQPVKVILFWKYSVSVYRRQLVTTCLFSFRGGTIACFNIKLCQGIWQSLCGHQITGNVKIQSIYARQICIRTTYSTVRRLTGKFKRLEKTNKILPKVKQIIPAPKCFTKHRSQTFHQ